MERNVIENKYSNMLYLFLSLNFFNKIKNMKI